MTHDAFGPMSFDVRSPHVEMDAGHGFDLRADVRPLDCGESQGTTAKKLISIVAGCFNEEGNIGELHERITRTMSALPQYDFEILLIDNASTDSTVDVIRCIAKRDPRLKAIINVRNFGHIRSPYHALLLAA